MALGWIALGLGALGSFLPILPTTPFILLAAYLFSKSSDKLYNWLIKIPKFGKVISDWNENGVVSNSSKFICIVTLLSVSVYISILTSLTIFLKTLIILILFTVGLFVITRPSISGGLIEKS
jgi:uncharacterized membrane protein YbaN (DUF454 family)